LHITKSDDNMYDIKDTKDNIIVANGTKVEITKIGKIKLRDRNNNTITLKNVAYVPEIQKNLISFTKLMDKDSTMITDDASMTIKKGEHELRFEKQGHLFFLMARCEQVGMIGATTHPKTMDINKAHDMFGHVGENALCKVATSAEIKSMGKVTSCEACI